MRQIRFILLAIFCLLSFSAFGQLKTVSVPPVVNKTNVGYSTTKRLHQAISRAIGGKHGYIVYDRNEGVEAILNEHTFQRSGLVSSATMQRLGAATGAQYVLYSEVVYENNKLYLYVQLLNVQSMRVDMSFDLSQPNTDIGIDQLCKDVDMHIRAGGDAKATAVRIYDYLTIFPRDLGEFKTAPTALIAAINKANTEGYNSWRLPTSEELSMMRASAYEIPNFSPKPYMTSDIAVYDTPVAVRLVTTGQSAASIAEDKAKRGQYRKAAILALCGVSESSCYVDEQNRIIVFNKDIQVEYYENRYSVIQTQLNSPWRYASEYELQAISDKLTYGLMYVYDQRVDFKYASNAEHKVYYVSVYQRGAGSSEKVSGRWSKYDKSGVSYRKSGLYFYTRPVMDFPSEETINAQIDAMMK